MLDEEDDAIAAFIRDSSITVISQSRFYAQDSVTDVSKNEYVQLASGVYMQIVDAGVEDETDTMKNNDVVLTRFSEYCIIEDPDRGLYKGMTYSNLDIVYSVDAFRYVETSTSIAGIFTGRLLHADQLFGWYGSACRLVGAAALHPQPGARAVDCPVEDGFHLRHAERSSSLLRY